MCFCETITHLPDITYRTFSQSPTVVKQQTNTSFRLHLTSFVGQQNLFLLFLEETIATGFLIYTCYGHRLFWLGSALWTAPAPALVSASAG